MIALGNESIRGLSRTHGHRTHTAADAHVAASEDGTDDPTSPTWTPPILKCVATRGEGIDELVEALDRHEEWLRTSPTGRERKRERLGQEVRDALREALVEAAVDGIGAEIEAMAARVEARTTDPYSATEELVDAFRKSHP